MWFGISGLKNADRRTQHPDFCDIEKGVFSCSTGFVV
jgi:hypothetical protein